MSYIAFTDCHDGPLQGATRRISGCEREHVSLLSKSGADVPDIVRWLHAWCELGGWVRDTHRAAFADAIRAACEQSVRLPDGAGAYRVDALRVGMSAYGRPHLNTYRDGLGPAQTWWSLCEWLRASGGDVVLSYSVCGAPWDWEEFEHVADMGAEPFRRWLREERTALEWRPPEEAP